MVLLELLQKSGHGDFLKELAELVLQRLMEFEVEGLIGAAKHERSESRLNQRNGLYVVVASAISHIGEAADER